MNALQVQQPIAARGVCGVGCCRWSKRKLLDKVGWLSVRQLVFFHTVLQAHKTIKSGLPNPLHQAISCQYPYRTRLTTSGMIRQGDKYQAKSSFRYRVTQCFNQVPANVRVGTLATVKRKLKQWIKSDIPIDKFVTCCCSLTAYLFTYS